MSEERFGIDHLLVSSRDPDQWGNRGRSGTPALCLQRAEATSGAAAEKEACSAGSSAEMSLCRR